MAKFLLKCNLDNYDPKVIPISAYAKEVMENDKSPEDMFLDQWDGVELPATAFFRAYCTYCQNNELTYAPNAKSLSYKLLTAIRDGKLLKRRAAAGWYYSKP